MEEPSQSLDQTNQNEHSRVPMNKQSHVDEEHVFGAQEAAPKKE